MMMHSRRKSEKKLTSEQRQHDTTDTEQQQQQQLQQQLSEDYNNNKQRRSNSNIFKLILIVIVLLALLGVIVSLSSRHGHNGGGDGVSGIVNTIAVDPSNNVTIGGQFTEPLKYLATTDQTTWTQPGVNSCAKGKANRALKICGGDQNSASRQCWQFDMIGFSYHIISL